MTSHLTTCGWAHFVRRAECQAFFPPHPTRHCRYAIVICCIGTCCNAAMMTFSGKVLSEKLDVVKLTFYTAPVSLACLAPFFWAYEVGAGVCGYGGAGHIRWVQGYGSEVGAGGSAAGL